MLSEKDIDDLNFMKKNLGILLVKGDVMMIVEVYR